MNDLVLTAGLADPALTSLSGVIDRLTWQSLPPTLIGVVGALRGLYDERELLVLYALYFPDDYRRSQLRGELIEGELHSPKEIEFFELVSERLFPLPVDWIKAVYLAEGEERLFWIPFVPQGLAINQHYFFLSEMPLSWRLLFFLMGYVSGIGLAPEDADLEEALVRLPIARQGEDALERLEAPARRRVPPWARCWTPCG